MTLSGIGACDSVAADHARDFVVSSRAKPTNALSAAEAFRRPGE